MPFLMEFDMVGRLRYCEPLYTLNFNVGKAEVWPEIEKSLPRPGWYDNIMSEFILHSTMIIKFLILFQPSRPFGV